MACKYMIFLPVFLAFLIHRIVFSSHYRQAMQCTHFLIKRLSRHVAKSYEYAQIQKIKYK